MDHIRGVREFIIEHFLYGDAGSITDEASFLGSGIVDSTGVLELVSFLEETFHITIGDDEIIPENLDSLENIEYFLKRKLDGRDGP